MDSIQFVFYMGWLKVVLALLNPMGEDDDDFECNFLLDRNLAVRLLGRTGRQIGLTSVTEGYNIPPAVEKDIFWEGGVQPLYSEEAARISVNFLKGSAIDE